MATQLNTVSGFGSQTTTETPQSAGQGNAGGTRSSNLQPGTSPSLLNSTKSGGVPLQNNGVSTISLAPTAAAQTQTVTGVAPQTKPYHYSPVAIAFPATLFVVALIMVWLTNRSAKNTTYY
ncbi:hypothetical protein COY17_02170 [Candidatus Saccharibacteria bacterium CG_4_10_14_0_2_um_filter_52_9]|nr:MAG: hypothetical protein COY17_02170 [Candidatus Saccharibacteria bacterium CG_4_10_14_0_2_um_filter_52_9]